MSTTGDSPANTAAPPGAPEKDVGQLPLQRVFLSYGRADSSDLADKLAHDLEHHTLASDYGFRLVSHFIPA